MRPAIYLDYAASTPVDPSVLEAMQVAMTAQGNYANPSSTHSAGRESVDMIAQAAEQTASLLNHPAQQRSCSYAILAVTGMKRQTASPGIEPGRRITSPEAILDPLNSARDTKRARKPRRVTPLAAECTETG